MSGKISYAKKDNRYVIKFSGEIRYTDCPALDAFLNSLFARADLEDILVDLTETTSIDSTNLGYLAKITNFMQERFGKKAVLISTDENINRTLEGIGFYDVFNIIDQRPQGTDGSQIELHGVSELTPAMILEAHQVLCDLNEENQKMFKEVVELFEKEAEEE